MRPFDLYNLRAQVSQNLTAPRARQNPAKIQNPISGQSTHFTYLLIVIEFSKSLTFGLAAQGMYCISQWRVLMCTVKAQDRLGAVTRAQAGSADLQ
jgi:hypothetical protein